MRPEDVAAAFAKMGSDQQAGVLSMIWSFMKSFGPGKRAMQCAYIRQEMDDEARALIEELTEPEEVAEPLHEGDVMTVEGARKMAHGFLSLNGLTVEVPRTGLWEVRRSYGCLLTLEIVPENKRSLARPSLRVVTVNRDLQRHVDLSFPPTDWTSELEEFLRDLFPWCAATISLATSLAEQCEVVARDAGLLEESRNKSEEPCGACWTFRHVGLGRKCGRCS